MDIFVKEDPRAAKETINIKCFKQNEKIKRVVLAIKSVDDNLKVYADKEAVLINKSEILYIEVVDRKIFVYTSDTVYELKKSLEDLEKELYHYGFFRVSRTTLLNINKVKSIKPLGNQKFIARVGDFEKVEISRKYARKIIEILN
ncbi:LytTR family transcriptional regulator [Vagococcus sp. BWB3-3]|uniref:LytTR family transcriptional regulator n=1 Tax=Vagococcus allomyrinae TaxID=2794353 RepID=A0A940PGH6_9ENTE|nr:LytTR family DNA-binding domain-containing protein [Vagococcus allomyrinae]MBP1044440.1 LytTR family transcriptional regulator [Vagococcus allomyrinae]